MYYGTIFVIVILFLIIVIITILLTLSSDTLNRLPSNIYTDTLNSDITEQTFAVLTLIFLVGFTISLGVLVYYKSSLVSNPTVVNMNDNSFISASRVDSFVYGFVGIILIGLLIVLALTWTSLDGINFFLSSFESVVTPETVTNVRDARSNTRIALALEVIALLFVIFTIAGYASGS